MPPSSDSQDLLFPEFISSKNEDLPFKSYGPNSKFKFKNKGRKLVDG